MKRKNTSLGVIIMFYESTRGHIQALSSADVIKEGISKDGGLFVPENYPTFSLLEISNLVPMAYPERAIIILKRFLTDFTLEEIQGCTEKAYTNSKFSHPQIAPVKKIDDKIYILELWHGPTAAFKDMALQILPHLLTKSIHKTKEQKEILILVATSGDTGKAALEGFKNVPGTKVLVFYPNNGVSEVQKLQMITQEGRNTISVGLNGNFDQAQTAVKSIFSNKDLNLKLDQKGVILSSANSINWGRLVPQIVYYFSSYADLLSLGEIKIGEKINFVVPTGNFGNILAGYYATKMGLPVNRLICASNQNNILTDFIHTGEYNQNRPFYKSISPSMDILISSNLERLLFDITFKDSLKVTKWMKSLMTEKFFKIDEEIKNEISAIFWSGYSTEEETLRTISRTYQNTSYLLDTHTSVAMNVYEKYEKETKDQTKTIIASTASPFKFPHSVSQALWGLSPLKDKSEFHLLEDLSLKMNLRIPDCLKDLNEKKILHNKSCNVEDMKELILTL
jgi:threonine synthase